MKRQEVVDKIKKIIIESMGGDRDISEIQGNNLVSEIGINSVDALEILVRIESEFSIQIADEDLSIDLITTIDKLATYVIDKSKGEEYKG